MPLPFPESSELNSQLPDVPYLQELDAIYWCGEMDHQGVPLSDYEQEWPAFEPPLPQALRPAV